MRSRYRQRPANLIAALRQLAVANLPGKIAWEAALPVLRDLMPFQESSLFWIGEGGVEDFQVGSADSAAALQRYVQEGFADNAEVGGIPDFMRFIASGQAMNVISDAPGYRRSSFHRQICQPLEINHMIRFAIRPPGAKPFCLALGRGGSRGYIADELARMRDVLPLLAHLLTSRGQHPEQSDAPSDKRELLVVDRTGTIHYATANAIYLACHAAGLGVDPNTYIDHGYRMLRPFVGELAKRVFRLDEGRESALPVQTVHGLDGNYALRAYRLYGRDGSSALAAIQVERQIPLLVRLYRAGRLQRLPPREQQLVPLLLSGLSATVATERLGLRAHTTTSYIASLYRNLGISRRDDLLPALLREDSPR